MESVLPIRTHGAYRQSSLVLGTAQLGMAYGIANRAGVPDDDTVAGILETARRLGVSHVDTARAYGESERRIGTALRGRDDLAVITKIAPGGAVRESLDRSRAALERRGPLTVLLHRAADVDDGWADLRQVLHSGEANRIGVSVQSPAELYRILPLPDLGYVQLPCNVLDRRWLDPRLTEALAAREDLVVTVRSAYLQGLLVAGTAVTWPHLPDTERDAVVALLDGLVDDLGRTGRDDLCIAYLLSFPWVTSVVVGAETEDQLRVNADLAGRTPLTEAERESVLATLPEMPADLLDPSRWSA
ncbi:aldo/keto reductase [Actinoplanes sp. TBRC 11911]|uniref:aldo/keto reductase n=1 Tax=Actinoplanes sp. TBRC 11911 TaxID=2729386 RepID=UPI00145C9189|nr:aldo/keto reductase [Actinoplanes sp. TBRC 11911]NMO55028.1 aldo/keto reductase [Actinoplanes sp. TBRC 11911]